MKVNRIKNIESYINEHKTATNQELCDKFGISMPTLRRYLKELIDQNRVTKVYGGVVSNSFELVPDVPPIEQRDFINNAQKEEVAKIAATLVQDNDVIFLDSGTTVIRMLPYLKSVKNLTVITHTLPVMVEASKLKHINLIILGGQFSSDFSTFQFPLDDYHFRVSKAFLATVGISLNDGLSNTDYKEGVIKHKVASCADEVIVMCDSSKFKTRGYHNFLSINQVTKIITDKGVEPSYRKQFEDRHIPILTREQ